MITQEYVQKKEKQWSVQKDLIQRLNKIKQEKKDIAAAAQNSKKTSTSKMVLAFLLFNFTLIQVFTGIVTWRTISLAQSIGSIDFTPLVTFIGAYIGQVVTYLIYSHKAMKQNTQGGVTYSVALKNNFQNDQGVG